ncbi:Mfs1.1 [Gloeophyllum trabeum ATCC 11539]|uniref:Mfs1.1 n=1 Tax=Gloeophyllum trabeum (strain ATCC 11539 / FP-39264 / Madison 617) TaxID=670483 RepID=S7RV19_GLOTA|nr:Mfs1.1 [Gloeophyllum trabeum ATCC 11539]EPQ58605.1 Mfs1.1 [Gloeophyllum trabeum ATCC 11539]
MDDLKEADRKRGWRFWVVIFSIALSMFIAALELVAVSTALPTIVNDLRGTEFIWVGSAYALASTAFIPLSGSLAQIFGRKFVMLASLIIFAVGSALCGAATSMNFLIAGRTVQGLGGGGIASLVQIILSDLVPLRERGIFNGLIGIAWSTASGIGPIVGGVLADHGQWRWLFYLNIPICGLAASLVSVFLQLRTPPGTFKEKMRMMDWLGNIMVIASTTAVVIALTWGGIQYSWGSPRVLVPLILGMLGLVAFITYEAKVPQHPIVPFALMGTRTGISGYAQTFLMPVMMMYLVYYLPTYYQACKSASPIASGVDTFTIAFILAPSGIIAGASVAASKKYCPQHYTGWVLAIIGAGLLSTVQADSPRSHALGFQAIASMGLGMLTAITYFPVLAPLPVSANAHALAFFTFLRNFAQVWGVTTGGTILQNGLVKRLPAKFREQFPQGTAIAYAIIPSIHDLNEPLKEQVRVAFGESIRHIWWAALGISSAGLLISLTMKSLPLHTSVDRDWALKGDNDGQSPERGLSSMAPK